MFKFIIGLALIAGVIAFGVKVFTENYTNREPTVEVDVPIGYP